jgi:ATP-binding cassette, subfamily F, member 3
VQQYTLHSYLGGWPEYVRVREEHGGVPPHVAPSSAPAEPSPATAAKTSKGKPKTRARGPSKNRLSEQEKAERAIEAAEAAMRALEDELADPAAWATQYEAAKSQARHTAARRSVEDAYSRLEALID